MKTMLKLAAVLFLAVMIVAAVAMQSAIKEARAEQQNLLQPSADAGVLPENKAAPQSSVVSDEVQKLRDANKDLPKLRNEVRQLRRQAAEMEKLRADNERLKNAPKPVPRQYPPDYIKKNAFVDAGLATPEATVQTFLWALTRRDYKRFMDCLSSEAVASMGVTSEEKFQQEASEASKVFPGFRIAEKKENSPDEVKLTIEMMPGIDGAGDANGPITLKRIGNEWKVGGFR
jgi:hypothetical protein